MVIIIIIKNIFKTTINQLPYQKWKILTVKKPIIIIRRRKKIYKNSIKIIENSLWALKEKDKWSKRNTLNNEKINTFW